MHGQQDRLLRLEDLAAWPAFRLGNVRIDPATRSVHGPEGDINLEPRVIMVLLALVDAAGGVVTRAELERRCWGGVFVSEDSINRAISALRRAGRTVGADSLGIETIPRTGYRLLIAETAAQAPEPIAAPAASRASRVSRRYAIAGGLAVVAAGAGVAVWQRRPDPEAAYVDTLIAQGRDTWWLGLPDAEAQGIGFAREAVRRDPARAEGWGLLALLLRNVVEYGDAKATTEAVTLCQQAARRALALDPRQGDALAAIAALPPMFGDWLGARARSLAALAAAPGNAAAVSNLGFIEMSTGRCAASLAIAERLVAERPLAAAHQHRRIYGLWTAGRISETDRAADRAMELWPNHPAVWFARLWTLLFTGRAAAARAMVEGETRLADIPPPYAALLALTARGIESPGSRLAADAIAGNTAIARAAPGLAVAAILHLSALGAFDAALDVAEGYLARRGPQVGNLRHTAAEPSLNEQHRRKTMMLWTPVTAPLRTSPRFDALVADIGMAEFWRRSGLVPDYRRLRAS